MTFLAERILLQAPGAQGVDPPPKPPTIPPFTKTPNVASSALTRRAHAHTPPFPEPQSDPKT